MGGGSHQTLRLERGRHRGPHDGACVMELASMLAGERFSDRPRCVDRVVAAYLRAFNDRLNDRDRQRLRPYAAAAVGSRAGRRERRRRREACLAFAGVRAGARLRIVALFGVLPALVLDEGAGELAAAEVMRRGDVDAGFALLDRLLGSEAAPLASPVAGVTQVGGAPAADLVAEPQRA